MLRTATVIHCCEGVNIGDTHQVVDGNPFFEGVGAAGLGTMGNCGELRQLPEGIAIVAKWLGADRQGLTGHHLVGMLKGRHQGIMRLKPEGIAHRAQLGGDGSPGAA